MLRGAITTTRLATITAIEHHKPSKFKMFSQQCHQFKENSPFATQDQKVAPTQSRHLARRITRDASRISIFLPQRLEIKTTPATDKWCKNENT